MKGEGGVKRRRGCVARRRKKSTKRKEGRKARREGERIQPRGLERPRGGVRFRGVEGGAGAHRERTASVAGLGP